MGNNKMRSNGEKWSHEVHKAMDEDVVYRAETLMKNTNISFENALKIIQIVGIDELGDLIGDLIFELQLIKENQIEE